MSDIYDAHLAAKSAALNAEAALSRLGNVPARPPVNGTGDAYYAKYWAQWTDTLAAKIDTKLGDLGYPK